MIVLGFDTETTGLNIEEDKIIEVGAILWETERRVPLQVYSTFIRPRSALPEGWTSPTGIAVEWLTHHGVSFAEAMGNIQLMIAAMPEPIIVAHNGLNFDKPITAANLEDDKIVAHGILSAHWIDTRQDLPFTKEPSSRRLIHLAAEHGFINPFEHRAIFDVMTMLRLMGQYSFEEIYALSKVPLIKVRAMTNYEQRQLAKDARFMWDGERKLWHKEIRENHFDREVAAAKEKGFTIVRL